MDKNGYSQLKRKLPYFVCGQFNPPFRRKENFAYTENFMLDFDHLSSKQLSLKEVREKNYSRPTGINVFRIAKRRWN